MFIVSLSAQEGNQMLMKDTSVLYKGKWNPAIYFETDIEPKFFFSELNLFLKEKFNTSLKVDFKNKTEAFYTSKEFVAPAYFNHALVRMHTVFITCNRHSLIWILFQDKEEFVEKWKFVGNLFLMEKLSLMYQKEFEVLKRQVFFLEKELDSYRNKLIHNRKLITKLEKENFSLEGLIREEEDALREMIKELSDKIKKWEKVKAVP